MGKTFFTKKIHKICNFQYFQKIFVLILCRNVTIWRKNELYNVRCENHICFEV